MEAKDYKIGRPYIIRSNDVRDNLMVGTFIGFEAKHNIPIFLVNGEELSVFSPVAEFNNDLWSELQNLSYSDQFKVVLTLSQNISVLG